MLKSIVTSHMNRFVIRLALVLSALAIGAGFFSCSRTEQPAGPPEKVVIAFATLPETRWPRLQKQKDIS